MINDCADGKIDMILTKSLNADGSSVNVAVK